MVELYPDLYLNEKNIEILFSSPEYIALLQKKRKKYRKLFNNSSSGKIFSARENIYSFRAMEKLYSWTSFWKGGNIFLIVVYRFYKKAYCSYDMMPLPYSLLIVIILFILYLQKFMEKLHIKLALSFTNPTKTLYHKFFLKRFFYLFMIYFFYESC